MKKFILSFLFLPSLVMGDHCDGGACPALEHIKDTGDEVAKDLLPYLGVGLILAVTMNSGSDQSSLSSVSYTHLRAHETPEHLVFRLQV